MDCLEVYARSSMEEATSLVTSLAKYCKKVESDVETTTPTTNEYYSVFEKFSTTSSPIAKWPRLASLTRTTRRLVASVAFRENHIVRKI